MLTKLYIPTKRLISRYQKNENMDCLPCRCNRLIILMICTAGLLTLGLSTAHATTVILDPFAINTGQINPINAQHIWRATQSNSTIGSAGGTLGSGDPYLLQLRFGSGQLIELTETGATGSTFLTVNAINTSITVSHTGAVFGVQLTDHAGNVISPLFTRVHDLNADTSLGLGISMASLLGLNDSIQVGGIDFSINSTASTSTNISIGNIGLVADDVTLVDPIPEPATMLLLGSGLAGFAGFRRRFKKK